MHELADDDPVELLMARLLDASPTPSDTAVEAAVAAHPELAAELRARVAFLRSVSTARESRAHVPHRIGDYELGERIGGGGMGVVHRAREQTTGRAVAVKLIRPEQLWFEGARARFRREIEAVAALSHPGIVTVLAVGEVDEVPYFAMELVDGRSLADVLDELRRQPLATISGDALVSSSRRSHVDVAVVLVAQVADALVHAHARGIVHRDVKPSNVMVDRDGRARIIDFGLAHVASGESLTRTGVQPGSLAYMSPEQVRGEPVDERTDVWSLGAVLYETLTLCAPFLGATEAETRANILAAAPTPLRRANARVPSDLAAIVSTALAPERGHRYAKMATFAADLHAYLAHEPIAARGPGMLLRARRYVQRRPGRTAGAMVLLLLLLLPTALLVQEHAARHAIEVEAERARLAESQSRTDAATAWRVVEFLESMFRDASPFAAQGRVLTLRDVLERGRQAITSELADEPRVRLRLLEALTRASVYSNLTAEASALLAETEVLFERVPPASPAERIERDWLRAQVLHQQGRRVEAEKPLRRLLADEAGADLPLVIELARVDLADVLHRTGRSDEARPLFERGMLALRAQLPPFAQQLGLPLMEYASFVLATQGGDAAAPLYAEMQRLAENLPLWSPIRLALWMAIEAQLSGSGQAARGLQIVQQALADTDRLGIDSRGPLRSYLLTRLARHLCAAGRLGEALRAAEQAVPIARAGFAQPTAYVVEPIAVLADANMRLGRFARARELAQEALNLAGQCQDMNKPVWRLLYAVLGEACLGSGQAAEACGHFEHALANATEEGEDVPRFVRTQLAKALCIAGSRAAARECADEALHQLRAASSRNPADHVDALANLAWCYTQLGDPSTGESVARTALAAAEAAHVENCRQAAWVWKTLGWALQAQGRRASAAESFERAASIYQATLADQPQLWVNCIELWGKALLDDGQFEAAEDQLLRVITIYERLLGPTHQNLWPCLVNLASAQLHQTRTDLAVASIDRLYAMLAKVDTVPLPIAGPAIETGRAIAAALADEARRRRRLEELAALAQRLLPPDHPSHRAIARDLELR
jgi:tetratricopeptide (TPR) repeat protein/tRNA A-37 threonylcarbamoyl transferase component Bud32